MTQQLPDELAAWLTADHAVAPDGWADAPPDDELGCDARLVERLAFLVRAHRPRRAFVAGCPVIHHPSGPPYAAAWDQVLLLLDDRGRWITADAWPDDIAFARGTDVLRRTLQRAYDSAARA